jgi:hypothetical protein
MKGAWGEMIYIPFISYFLTSALEGGQYSASRPARTLPPRKDPPVTHCTGGLARPRAGWAQRVRGKTSASVKERTPVAQSVFA